MADATNEVDTYILQLNGRVWGLVLGLLSGFGLFFATLILVIRGGDDVGPWAPLRALGHSHKVSRKRNAPHARGALGPPQGPGPFT